MQNPDKQTNPAPVMIDAQTKGQLDITPDPSDGNSSTSQPGNAGGGYIKDLTTHEQPPR